jgi:hypothetical protein
MGLIAATHSTALAGELVLLVLFGVIGYLYALSTRRARGTTPWRLPALLWALVCALLPVYGFLLEMVAGLTTRDSRSRRPNMTAPLDQGQGLGGPGPWNIAPPPPANPAGGPQPWPGETVSVAGPEGWTSVPGGPPAPLFGWYRDPENLHEERYWDGRSWTDNVRDNGVVSVAPLQPARPPWHAPVSGVGAPPA